MFSFCVALDLSIKRKIEKHREKILKCDSALQRNSFVQSVPSSTLKKSKKKKKEALKALPETQDNPKVLKIAQKVIFKYPLVFNMHLRVSFSCCIFHCEQDSTNGLHDIWDDEGSSLTMLPTKCFYFYWLSLLSLHDLDWLCSFLEFVGESNAKSKKVNFVTFPN